MLAESSDLGGALLVSRSSDLPGSVVRDTIVESNCFLRIRGNLRGSLTVEQGANVIVEGSVDGKIINRGGTLVVRNRGIAEFVRADGPPEAEADGILRIDLSAITLNWEALAKRTLSECGAVVRADAYGCGIDAVSATLAASGCKTFFVSNLAEARRVRVAAPNATIYVLNGVYAGTGPTFAEVNAQPVINSLVEMAEWDAFVALSDWKGGFALNVCTGTGRLGISAADAAALSGRLGSAGSRATLLMSHPDKADRPDHPVRDRQIRVFQDLRRLYRGVPASLANSSGIFLGEKAHYDLVRAGSALYGVNPTPNAPNPMLPVIELNARIVEVRTLAAGETIAHRLGWAAKRNTRLAVVSAGYADGYPQSGGVSDNTLQAIVGHRLCPLVGRISMDLLAIDVTDLPNPAAARRGDMVTLIGGEISIDDLAAAANSTGCEVLCHLGRRFRRVYYAN